jgi:hypothetical protein
VLPGSGPAAQLLAAAGPAGVRRRPDLRLTLPGKAGPQAGRAEADLPCR